MVFYSARKSHFITQPSKLVQITKIGKVKEKKSRQLFFLLLIQTDLQDVPKNGFLFCATSVKVILLVLSKMI